LLMAATASTAHRVDAAPPPSKWELIDDDDDGDDDDAVDDGEAGDDDVVCIPPPPPPPSKDTAGKSTPYAPPVFDINGVDGETGPLGRPSQPDDRDHTRKRKRPRPRPRAWIYVLQLRGGKVYVGKSAFPLLRITEHKSAGAAAWTTLYPPVRVLSAGRPERHWLDEDVTTLEMMREYGVPNVRGGTFSRTRLPEHQEKTAYDLLVHADATKTAVMVYALKCADACYFVGCRGTALDGLADHRPTGWTLLHRPEEALDHGHLRESVFDAVKVTVDLMRRHSVDAVRGGPFSLVKLPAEHERTARDMIIHGTGACYTCLRTGHYAAQCPGVVAVAVADEKKEKRPASDAKRKRARGKTPAPSPRAKPARRAAGKPRTQKTGSRPQRKKRKTT